MEMANKQLKNIGREGTVRSGCRGRKIPAMAGEWPLETGYRHRLDGVSCSLLKMRPQESFLLQYFVELGIMLKA